MNINQEDLSGNLSYSTRFLNTIINELLNGIDDDDIENPSIFNPFSNHTRNNQRRNYSIGRNIEQGSHLFNMVNQLFDTSNNIFNTIHSTRYGENENTASNLTPSSNATRTTSVSTTINHLDNDMDSIEEVTFHITYPPVSSTNPYHTRSYSQTDMSMNSNVSNPLQRHSFASTLSNTLNDVLARSLYDESSYKKKISEKGKQQLIHLKFDKNDIENINTTCPIMQTEFEEEQYIIRLPCNHNFTPFAINKWLDEKPECPVCRYQLDSVEIKRYEDSSTETTNTENHIHSLFQMFPNPNPNPNRQIHHRINLGHNSYLDYIYDDLDNDNDFQRALILSYREELTDADNSYNQFEYPNSYDLIYNETSITNIHRQQEEENQEEEHQEEEKMDDNDDGNDTASITLSTNSDKIYDDDSDSDNDIDLL